MEEIKQKDILLNDSYNYKTISYHRVKRIIDFFGSLIGIILLSPIMLITSIAIKIESRGPAFFIQERVGKDGKLFRMYKFRSMCINAEEKLKEIAHKNEMDGPMFKIKEDPRITRIGKIIRRRSLDELPQLFNVIKGEMSLVGPRPNLPREVEKFTEYHKKKLIAKPGLTCYWQIMGRNNIDFEQWINLDIKYIEERSTWVDIKLIFKTIKVFLGDEGAR